MSPKNHAVLPQIRTQVRRYESHQLNFYYDVPQTVLNNEFTYTDHIYAAAGHRLSDTLNPGAGNPDLTPEFTNSLKLSYQKIYGEQISMSCNFIWKALR